MSESPRRFSPLLWLLLAGAVGLALLPWWRHHGYLRDLFDYGIVIEANGRFERGERPYVDFKTPIQAGFLGLNWLVERVGGGDYRALTRGGAALIVVTVLGLVLLLARRWPAWAAVAVGLAVTVSGASQHTILWHNSLGLFCLAAVTWAAACAPVARRETWRWHVIVAAGLFLGGINKLNFQLVALAFAGAWAARAGLQRDASWRRVMATIAGLFIVGLGLPVAAELAWTGASLRDWLINVVQLAAGGRAEFLGRILTPAFLFKPIHDYYGTLLLPQAGLAGLLALAAATLVAAWTVRASLSRLDRWLLPVAVVLASGAGAALLATNYEIACVGLGAWCVLITSVWLGFGLDGGRRRVLAAGLVLPALIVGGTAWGTAWQGNRSQFGFSRAPRDSYRLAENAGVAFTYLRGLRLPPEVWHSFELLERTLPAPGSDGLRPVFYGPGLEFADRFYPAVRVPGRPLWGHWGTSYGPREIEELTAQLVSGRYYKTVVVTIGFEDWPDALRHALQKYYVWHNAGAAMRAWTWRDEDTVDFANVFRSLERLGGNLDGRRLHFDHRPLGSRRLAGEGFVLGTDRADGAVLVRAPFYRMRGVAVIERLPGAGDGPVHADFKVTRHGAVPEEARWAGRLELPAGQRSARLTFEADGFALPVELWARQESDRAGIYIGFRELEITNAIDAEGDAPTLALKPLASDQPTPEMLGALFGDVAWRPQRLSLRGGRPEVSPAGLELSSGGELWLHTDRMTGELAGELSLPRHSPPVLFRVVWYKGARVQVLQNGWIQPGDPTLFRAWTAEAGGWIGLVIESTDRPATVRVKVTRSTLSP